MWFELSGNDAAQLKERSKLYMKGKAVTLQNPMLKSSAFLSGGKVLALNPTALAKLKVSPIAEAHPDFQTLGGGMLPHPRGTIEQLLKAVGGEKVDVRGLITSLRRSAFVKTTSKWEVWLKDDSGKEILLELWGKTFDKECADLAEGDVVQVDNAALKKKDGSTVLSAECFADDPKGGGFLHVNPEGPRTGVLKQLGIAQGDRISDSWSGGSGGFFTKMSEEGETVLTCMSTLKACPLAWGAPALSSGGAAAPSATAAATVPGDGAHALAPAYQSLASDIRVAVHGVFLIAVEREDPVYVECANCKDEGGPRHWHVQEVGHEWLRCDESWRQGGADQRAPGGLHRQLGEHHRRHAGALSLERLRGCGRTGCAHREAWCPRAGVAPACGRPHRLKSC